MTVRPFLTGIAVGMLTNACGAQAQDRSVFDQYFALYETEIADDLPLAENVTFDGSLLSETIEGKEAVVAFLNRVVPNLGIVSVDIRQKFETANGACAEIVFEYKERGTVKYAHCLDIADGQITAIRLYFDPRPFLIENED